jgi:hypothetical protein
MYVAGEHRNILGVQSHPEFDYEYAIEQRIWKVGDRGTVPASRL